MTKKLASYGSISWSLIILIIVFIPGDSIPKHSELLDILQVDKLIHILLFAPFSFLWLLNFSFKINFNLQKTYLVFFLGVFLASATEIIQFYFIEGRNGSLADAIADIVGVYVGIVICNYYLKRTKEHFFTKLEK